jgi:predicted XRE-type DNA-binding protein
MIERPEDIEALRTIKLELRQEILKAFAVMTIGKIIDATGLHQSDISYLKTDSKLNRFSLDRLVLILIAMRRHAVIKIAPPAVVRAAE